MSCAMEDEEEFGLREFWSSLDEKQKHALLALRRETVCSRVRCRTCKDLLLFAIRTIERGQGKTATSSLSSSTGKGAHAAPVLSRLNGGLFVPGVGPASPLLLTAAGGAGGGASSAEGAVLNGTGAADAATAVTSGGEAPMGFASFHGLTFELLESGPLAHLLLDDDGEGGGGGGGGSEEEKREAGVGGGRMVKAGTRVCPHCLNKLHVKFVDMLTYPRPVRKFEMLVNASMRLHALKELLWREVGLEGPSLLELRLRNRPITGDAANDDKTLAELGFASGMQVVVSRVLGARAEDQQGLHEKNKQFVGDLLFGQAPQGAVDPAATGAVPPAAGAAGAAGGTAPAAGAKGAKGRAGKGAGKSGKGAGKGSATTAAEANEEAPAPVSIVDSFRITGGYQILGRTLEALAREAVRARWQEEKRARASERALLEALEAEETEGGEEDAKRRGKKQKRKEKERARKQAEAEKKRLAEEEREREQQARIKAAQERAEAERRARLEQLRREAEEEKRRLQQALEQKRQEEVRLFEERRRQREAEEEEARRRRQQQQQHEEEERRRQKQQLAQQQQQQAKQQKQQPPARQQQQQQLGRAAAAAASAAPTRNHLKASPPSSPPPARAVAAAATSAGQQRGKRGAQLQQQPPPPLPAAESARSGPARGAAAQQPRAKGSPPQPASHGGAAPPMRPPPVLVPSLRGLQPSAPAAAMAASAQAPRGLRVTAPPPGGLGGLDMATAAMQPQPGAASGGGKPRFCSQCGSALLGAQPKFCSQCGSAVHAPLPSAGGPAQPPMAMPPSMPPGPGAGDLLHSPTVLSPRSPAIAVGSGGGWDPIPLPPGMLPHHNPHPPHAHPMHPRSAPVTPRQEASAPTLGDSPPLPPYLIGTMGPPPQQPQPQPQQGTPRPTTVGGFEGPPSGPSPVRGEEAGAAGAGAGAGGDANGAGGLPFFQRLRIG